MTYPLAVSAWSAMSPLGADAGTFGRAVRSGASGVRVVPPGPDPLPQQEAGVVDGFDVRTSLGRKGTRSMDRATGLAVATVGNLLNRAEPDVRATTDGEVGLVLGTNTGSVQSMMDFTKDSMLGDKPYYVDPARFPNTVMNCAAGQCAIWHQLRGPNTTIAGGHVTGLLALQYAQRLHRCGHAGAVLCGAVEEFSTQRAWLEWLPNNVDGHTQPLGEGCVVFLLEDPHSARRHGRSPLADLLAIEFGVSGPEHSPREVLARCVTTALRRAGIGPRTHGTVAPGGYPDARGAAESAALDSAAPGWSVQSPVSALTGDTSAASAAFQLAALLATAPRGLPEHDGDGGTGAAGRLGMVTSIDREGLVGCAILRLW